MSYSPFAIFVHARFSDIGARELRAIYACGLSCLTGYEQLSKIVLTKYIPDDCNESLTTSTFHAVLDVGLDRGGYHKVISNVVLLMGIQEAALMKRIS